MKKESKNEIYIHSLGSKLKNYKRTKLFGWLKLSILLVVATYSILIVFPTKVTSKDAPLDQFSAERAIQHLNIIARQPHPAGSEAQMVVRDYLVEQLSNLGLEVELQQKPKVDNVVARYYGNHSSGAIVILAHYDSVSSSPGAADNGAGVAVLLECVRALVSGPKLQNDLIILFDDSEETPDAFTGTKLFVREHRWMSDVKVAISLDTAVNGPISINETGKANGWLVKVLAETYTNGAWSSMSGGGNYDVTPFRNTDVMILAMEDNYPFKEQHTKNDRVEIVSQASVQQMGDQVLAISRELGKLDLRNPYGEHETFFPLRFIGLIHYPESRALPLTIVSGVIFFVALGLNLWRKIMTWRGFGISLLATLLLAAISALFVGWTWPQLPGLLGWKIHQLSEWPEVIPQSAGWIDLGFAILILLLAIYNYQNVRRWSSPIAISFSGLLILWIPAIITAVIEPRGSYLFVWPVFIGSITWALLHLLNGINQAWLKEIALLLPALVCIVLILPFIPGVVMGDGMKSLSILAAVWVILLSVILPCIDELLLPIEDKIKS